MNTLGADRWSAIGETHNMYGSAQGCLGLVAHLSPILFAFLKEVESRLAQIIVPVGNFSQESWRSCKDCLWTVRVAHNIIDGELIENFLDLSLEDKSKVVQGLRIPVSEQASRVEVYFSWVSSFLKVCFTIIVPCASF